MNITVIILGIIILLLCVILMNKKLEVYKLQEEFNNYRPVIPNKNKNKKKKKEIILNINSVDNLTKKTQRFFEKNNQMPPVSFSKNNKNTSNTSGTYLLENSNDYSNILNENKENIIETKSYKFYINKNI